MLSEAAAGAETGDKDDDMADEPSPALERALGFGNIRTWASHEVVFLASISPLKIYYSQPSAKSLPSSNKKKKLKIHILNLASAPTMYPPEIRIESHCGNTSRIVGDFQ